MLSPKIHGWLDYITVLFFALAPSIFALSETAAVISYVLAVVHLLMTLITAFPLSVKGWIQFRVHGYVELIVSLVLLIGPWLLSDLFTQTDQVFFTICGAVILIVYLLTSYKSEDIARA